MNDPSQSVLPKLMTLVKKGILRPLSLIMDKFYLFDVLVIQLISKKNSPTLRKHPRKLHGTYQRKLTKMEA